VEAFNSYFKKVADNHNKIKANSKHMSSTDNGGYMAYMNKAFGSPFPKIQISKSTSVEIERIIKPLKSSCTYGYDEISNNILKSCKTFISTPLSYLCNRVLSDGVFPDRLKYATFIPVFKKGDRKDQCNYRPISILTSFNKIFEKVMYSRLVQHLNDHNILSKYQYCFRAKLGTDNAIFNLITEILHSLNHKSMIGGIFCDLEKAFDCVSHEVLLNKLKFYGIIHIQNNLYRSYLQDRFQRTAIMNGLDNNKVSSEWAINTVKTQYINFITKNSRLIQKEIGVSEIITSAKQVKFLGLAIISTFTWETYIDSVKNKLCTACYIIRNIKPFMPVSTMKSIYYSYFHSVMTYGLISCGNSSHADKVLNCRRE
jgi:Notch-like protein